MKLEVETSNTASIMITNSGYFDKFDYFNEIVEKIPKTFDRTFA